MEKSLDMTSVCTPKISSIYTRNLAPYVVVLR